MKKTYKKYLIIFTLIISVFICTACSEDKKDDPTNLGDVVDALTAANMTKYVDESRKAQDKLVYDELKACLTVAAASPESYKFCEDNAPITATVNNRSRPRTRGRLLCHAIFYFSFTSVRYSFPI